MMQIWGGEKVEANEAMDFFALEVERLEGSGAAAGERSPRA